LKNDINYVALGLRIKELRKNKKWTQEDLAVSSNQTKVHISHIETGITKLSLPSIISIANALEVSVDNLLCDSIIKSEYIFIEEFNNELSDCTAMELKIILNTIKSLKNGLRDIKNDLYKLNEED